jgi:subtilase family protein
VNTAPRSRPGLISRRWRSAIAVAGAAAVVSAVGIVPAQAQWKAEYWFADLDVKKSWTITQGAGVTVGVVDSGVVDKLGDLRGQVLPGVDLSGHTGDGRADPGEDCGGYGGCYSHGTQMALLIAGSGAGKGFQGIAPKAKILPVKVSTSTAVESTEQVDAQGIRWAVDHGAQVVNVSIGGGVSCNPDEGAAVKYAYQHNVIVVASAGNEATSVSTPANCPGALAVGGTDVNFNPWSRTNFGPEVAFTGAAADTVQESLNGTELRHGSGTSDATAIVSGSLALIRAHFPDMSARDIVTRAIHTVHNGTGKFGVRIDDKRGYGQILPYFAMTYPVPANASNPIYDAWAKKLGPATPEPSDSGSPPGSTPSKHGITAQPGPHAGTSNNSSLGLMLGIAAAALVVLAVIGAVLRARRRPPANPPSWNPGPPS